MIQKSIIYVIKLKLGYLLKLYYLFFEKKDLKEKNI